MTGRGGRGAEAGDRVIDLVRGAAPPGCRLIDPPCAATGALNPAALTLLDGDGALIEV